MYHVVNDYVFDHPLLDRDNKSLDLFSKSSHPLQQTNVSPVEEIEAADSIDSIHAIVVGFGAKRAPSAQTFRLVVIFF